MSEELKSKEMTPREEAVLDALTVEEEYKGALSSLQKQDKPHLRLSLLLLPPSFY